MKIQPNVVGATLFLVLALAAIGILVFNDPGTMSRTDTAPERPSVDVSAEIAPQTNVTPSADTHAPTPQPSAAPEAATPTSAINVPNSPVPVSPVNHSSRIAGTIVDPLGNPMPMMRAHLISAVGRDTTSHVTREDGVFRMTEVEPGAYQLIALREGNRSKTLSGAQAIHLAENEVITDIRLVYRGGLHTISGRVTDVHGAPILEVRVSAHSNTTIAYGKVETDTNGQYTIDVDPGQNYKIDADRSGYVYPEPYESVPAGARDVDFTLAASAAVSGQLVDAATGEPIQNFGYTIHAGAQTQPDYARSVMRGIDDPDGRFHIEGIEPGQYTLEFRAQGYAPRLHVFSAVSGEHVDNLRLPMHLGARIEGEVVNQAGKPVPGAAVRLTDRAPMDAATHNLPEERFYTNGSTDADGHFVIDSIGADVSVLLAQHADYADTVVAVSPKPKGVTHVDITLHNGGSLSGTLYVNGGPKNNERVRVRVPTRHAPHSSSETDKDGRFAFTRLPDGEVLVMASVDQGSVTKRIDRTVVVVNGKNTLLDFHFQFGTAALTGILSINGEIPHSGQLTLFPLDTNRTLEDRSSSGMRDDGTYLLDGIPPGAYTLHIRASPPGRGITYVRAEQVELSEGQHHDLNVDLRNNRIQGTVAGTLPGSDVRIVVFPGDMDPDSLEPGSGTRMGALARALTHSDVSESGTFELEGLSTGEYIIATVEFNPSGRPAAIHVPRRVRITGDTDMTMEIQTP